MADAVSFERARSALSHLDPNCDRETWVIYGMCLKNEFGDAGFDIWDEWSSQSDRYDAYAARSTWKSIKETGGRTIASLIHFAKQAGWKDSSGYKRPSPEELAKRKAAAEAREAQALEQEAKQHAEVAARALAVWNAAALCDAHPYLERKGVLSYGLRVGRWEVVREDTGEVVVLSEQALLVPMQDNKRGIWSLQAIFPKKVGGRDKDFLKGGKKRGHFFPIGKPQQRDGRPVFLLGEGYATCASVHAATGHLVLVCFDAGNLPAVARQIRAAKPDAVIMLLADNDTETEGNPGLSYALKAAKEVDGLIAVPPPGDFNDLQVAEGLDAVAGVIEGAWSTPLSAHEPKPEPAPEPKAPAADVPDLAPGDDDPDAIPPEMAPLLDGGGTADLDPEDANLNGQHFTVLGYEGTTYYVFSHVKKQVMTLSRADFTEQGFVELAPLDWWEAYFGNIGKPGFNRVRAFEWLIKVAHARGIFDPRRVRGRGAWRDRGRTVFHHGDHLTVDGSRVEIAHLPSQWVYPMAQSLTNPDPEPLTDEEGAHLLSVAKMARWTRPGSAALLAGWVFLAPVCGALSWRPHIWITGAAGSGKSTIQSGYVDALLDGIGVPLQGDSTEAGVRQRLRSDAVPALIDEFEPNDESERKRMKGVLTLMRQASSETSAQTVKGTVSGDAMSYHIRSMFCVASINTMLDKDADQSRITPLVLRPPAKTGSADDQWAQLEEELHKIGRNGRYPARLLSRSLSMLPTILLNVEVFCAAAAKRFGTQRQGDQYGTLLAGAWCMCSSKVATPAEAEAMINSYDWTDHTEVSGGPGDPEKALASIMESKVRVGGSDVTVFEILAEAAGRPVSAAQIGETACVDILRRNGILLESQTILFGVSSTNLRSLVKDTPYATDLRGQLSRLKGATNYLNKTRKFAGTNSKVITIPLRLVLDDEEPPI